MKGLHIIKSQHSAKETADRIVEQVKSEGLNLFARIDHAAQAGNVGIKLRPTEVLIFGNPKIGSQLMLDQQTTAIDLPVKALVWEEESGQVNVGYNTTEWLKERHGLTEVEALKKIGNKLHKVCSTAAEK